jgi:hypothetical protein
LIPRAQRNDSVIHLAAEIRATQPTSFSAIGSRASRQLASLSRRVYHRLAYGRSRDA